MKTVTVTAGLIAHNGRFLIAQRRKDKSLGGFWEFPGGKIEPGETCEQCLKREIKEEFDISIDVQDFIGDLTHNYDTFQLHMSLYNASWNGQGTIRICDHEQYAWVTLQEMSQYDWAGADIPFVEMLTKNLTK